MSTWPLLIFRSVGQRSVSKVKPILYMLGKGGISVLQTAIFILYFTMHFKCKIDAVLCFRNSVSSSRPFTTKARVSWSDTSNRSWDWPTGNPYHRAHRPISLTVGININVGCRMNLPHSGCFYALGSNDQGHIVFVLSVCMFVCLFVCLLSTLTFAITFEP